MAGERYASQLLVTDFLQTDVHIRLWLDGAYWTFFSIPFTTAPLALGEFIVSFPQSNEPTFLLSNGRSFGQAITRLVQDLGLPYTVEIDPDTAQALTSITIRATRYEAALDFQPTLIQYSGPGFGGSGQPGLADFGVVTTIQPVFVDRTVVDAGIFGSATGAITLAGRNGTNGVYSYTWADGPLTAARTALRARAYTCLVADTSGASTSVTITVLEDDQLEVVVDRDENDLSLRVSGGRAPYTYRWENGTTLPTRENLGPGNYSCTITDAVGATAQASVTIAAFQFYFSLNPILLALDAGAAYRADPTTKPNLSFLCEVFIEPDYLSEEFVRIGEPIEQPADRQGRTRFEVQTLLDTYLAEHLPAPGQRALTRADSLFKRFFLRTRERFGTPAVDGPQQLQQRNYVVLGGLDYFEYAARTWFSSYQAAVKPFLTWQPNDKAVHVEQPEYLYFMADSFTLTSLTLRVRVSCTDGSTEQFDGDTYVGPRRYEVFCLPVGYDALLLRRFESATRRVLGWSVQVVNSAGVPQSEERRYRLDYRYYPQKRYFLYSNSLGGVNSLACTGDAVGTLTPVQEEADRGPNPNYDPLLGDTVVLDRSGTMVLNVSTGLLSRAEMLHLQEFVLSRRVTMVTAGGYYWPGKVKPKALEAVNDSDTVRSYAFDFELPRQRVFSPRLPVASLGNTRPIAAGGGGQL